MDGRRKCHVTVSREGLGRISRGESNLDCGRIRVLLGIVRQQVSLHDNPMPPMPGKVPNRRKAFRRSARGQGALHEMRDFFRSEAWGRGRRNPSANSRSEEHTSELQSRLHLVCRLLLEKKKKRTCKPHRGAETDDPRRLPADSNP